MKANIKTWNVEKSNFEVWFSCYRFFSSHFHSYFLFFLLLFIFWSKGSHSLSIFVCLSLCVSHILTLIHSLVPLNNCLCHTFNICVGWFSLFRFKYLRNFTALNHNDITVSKIMCTLHKLYEAMRCVAFTFEMWIVVHKK